MYMLQFLFGLMASGLFWSLKCLILWGISSSWQELRSATNQQDQSLATELVRSREILCLLCLFPHVWELLQCPCVLESVRSVLGMAQHGFESIGSVPESCRGTVSSPEVMNCADNVAKYGWFHSWFRSHGSKSHSAKPRSVKFECFGLDEWSIFGFPLLFFYYCFWEIETTPKYHIKQVP